MSDDFFNVPPPPPSSDIEVPQNIVTKDSDVDLKAMDPALNRINVGLGWDFNAFDQLAVDMDACVFLLDHNGQTREDSDFVFYNTPETLDGAVKHHGDSKTGAGEGDDEIVSIDLSGIPFDIVTLEFVISIYKAAERDHDFSMVKNAYIRIVNAENAYEMARYNLDDIFRENIQEYNKKEPAVLVARLEREGPKWHFRPVAEFAEGGLKQIATDRGLVIMQQ